MSDDAAKHARAMLDALGLDPDEDDQLEETPQQFVDMLRNNFLTGEESPPATSTFPAETDRDEQSEPVVVSDIEFHSMCVHHVVPFFGRIDVAYIPDDYLTGFGSIGRVVDHFSGQLQLQERLVEDIAGHLQNELDPTGLLVRCRARQMCVELREPGKRASYVATASRGSLASGEKRREVVDLFDAPSDG